MKQHIENIEFLESTQGIKENEYKDQVLDLLDMYADFRKKDKNNSIIETIDDNCYRLRLAYFARFV